MRDANCYKTATALLPPEIRLQALALPEREMAAAEELRLRAGQPPSVLLPDGERPLSDAPVLPRHLEAVLETATRASAHTAMAHMASGFVTVRGGVRLGLCGEGFMSEGRPGGIRRLSSLALRLPAEIRGCADGIYPALRAGGFADTLIISPPGAGKTTLLRELCRLLSEDGLRVSLIDERGEVAGVWDGVPLFDVGRRTDVMTGLPKGAAAGMLVRAMNPQVLAMDEITTEEDAEAAYMAWGCGVRLLATIHGDGVRELRRRPALRALTEAGVFRRAVRVERRGASRRYTVEELGC